MIRKALLASAILLAAPAAASAQVPCDTAGPAGTAYARGVNCRTLQLDGHQRRYEVYVPANARPGAPVVFMFHGGSGNGEKFLNISGWREQADATGLIAVFPTGERYRITETGGLSTRWATFGILDEIEEAETPPADDVAFVDEMLSDLDAGLSVDRQRIYASGFSNGAGMTARLAVDRSETFAAVAFSAGGLSSVHSPVRAVPTYSTIGSLDDRALARLDPPLAELPLDPGDILDNPSLDAHLDVALDTLGLDHDLYGAAALPHSGHLRWPAARPLFRYAVLEGLEHRYPNGTNNPHGFAAAPEFWDFFTEHRLP
jgi:polyhydroxybutyrate depolymerase